MALNEFELIRRYFSDITPAPDSAARIVLGVGDDCAIIETTENQQLVFSIDTQVVGVHFPADAEAAWIAQRTFRAALSDVVAMGAEPLCFTLALTLPEANTSWLAGFADGLKQAASEYRCPLVGGDTTRGPLAITLQVQGTVPTNTALRRDGAKTGDVVLVSGLLGGAAAWVELMQRGQLGEKNMAHAEELFRQDYFFPRVPAALSKALRPFARSAIDISDGLLADLSHLCRASRLNAGLQLDKLPQLPELSATFGKARARQLALCGGDDYQLCFTAAENKVRKILSLAEDLEYPVTVIGQMMDTPFDSHQPVTCYDEDGAPVDLALFAKSGYTHF